MRGLLYKDTFPRLVRDIHDHPGKWASRLVLLLGPWTCLWMVEAQIGRASCRERVCLYV